MSRHINQLLSDAEKELKRRMTTNIEHLRELLRLATAAAPLPWDHGPLMSDGYRYSQITSDLLSRTRVGVVVDTLNADSVFDEREREIIVECVASAVNAMPGLLDELERFKSAALTSLSLLYAFLIGVPDCDIEKSIRNGIGKCELALISAGMQSDVDRLREGHRLSMQLIKTPRVEDGEAGPTGQPVATEVSERDEQP